MSDTDDQWARMDAFATEQLRRYEALKEAHDLGLAPVGPGKAIAYEYMREAFANIPFDEMPVEQQRDELLSAMGLILYWCRDQATLGDYPLMKAAITIMQRRFGPWAR